MDKMYAVYYKYEPNFREDKNLSERNYLNTHTFLMFVTAKNLDEVFYKCQGEVWSPRGEGKSTIKRLGLKHTSMCIGDLIRDMNTHILYEVASEGFREIQKENV